MNPYLHNILIPKLSVALSKGGYRISLLPITLRLDREHGRFDLGNSVYILTSDILPLESTVSLVMSSSDNYFRTNKTYFETLNLETYQVFSDWLIIEAKNYSKDDPKSFIPFSLEFLRLIPTKS